jgi:hypothetical protein
MSSSSLKSEKMFIEEYVQLTGDKSVDLECNIIELVEMAWNREAHLDLDWNEDWNGGE